VKLGRRHVRRGHLAKIRDDKCGLVARMREAPPHPQRFHPRPGVIETLRAAGASAAALDLSPRVPWSEGEVMPIARLSSWRPGVSAALLVPCDPRDFGGGYDLLAGVRAATELRAGESAVVALDYVTSTVQIERAAKNGADAIVLIARLVDDVTLQSLVAAARVRALEPIVECASEDELHRARTLEVRAAAFSFRDRDHGRAVVADAALTAAFGGFASLGLSLEPPEPTSLLGFDAMFPRGLC
jgi:hypothetical protein